MLRISFLFSTFQNLGLLTPPTLLIWLAMVISLFPNWRLGPSCGEKNSKQFLLFSKKDFSEIAHETHERLQEENILTLTGYSKEVFFLTSKVFVAICIKKMVHWSYGSALC